MLEEPKIKKVDKRDKQLPQNFEQLIEMYDVEKIWPYMKKVIDYINNDLDKVAVSPTEPVNKEEVWLQKNKNLFNALTTFASGWSTVTAIENTNNGIMFKGSASTWQYVSFLLDLKAGTYAFKRKWKLTSGTQDNHTGEVNISKKSDSSNLLFLSSSMSDGVFTITEDTTIRIVFYLNRAVALTEETQIEVYDIQLEKGSEVTEYTPYVENKILTKNSKGKYEEFMKESVVISPTEPKDRRDVWIQIGKNLLDLGKCSFNGCILRGNGTVVSSFSNGYYCTVYTKYLNEFLMANKGKSITFSIRETLANRYISIVISGKRKNGSTYQEVSTASSRQITCTIAEDFEEITGIELRFNRSYTAFADTTTVVSNLQLEIGSEATSYEEPIKKIYVKNNGVYEEFVNAETMGIETITNENGTAIKFPDGTLICRNTVKHTGISFAVKTDTTSNVSRVESTSAFDLGNYAHPFIEKPTLTCKGHSSPFAEPLEIYNGDGVNYIGKCYLWSWTVQSNATIYLSYIAIGKWK